MKSSYRTDKLKEEIELRRKLMATDKSSYFLNIKPEKEFDNDTHKMFY